MIFFAEKVPNLGTPSGEARELSLGLTGLCPNTRDIAILKNLQATLGPPSRAPHLGVH